MFPMNFRAGRLSPRGSQERAREAPRRERERERETERLRLRPRRGGEEGERFGRRTLDAHTGETRERARVAAVVHSWFFFWYDDGDGVRVPAMRDVLRADDGGRTGRWWTTS